MIISIIVVLASVAVSGQSLTLTVKDVEHVEGTLYVAIYSSKENFMKKPLFGFRVAVKDLFRRKKKKNFPNRICFPIGKTELWSTRQQSAGCRIIILNE